MNEKTAVLKTYIMWSWLAKNPKCEKEDYYLYKELNYSSLHQACPLCEWSKDNNRHDNAQCFRCILYEARQMCDIEHSWYRIYIHGSIKEASIAAGNIATLAWKRYEELGG